ncbi:MAG TPA: hypothetical protein VK043_12455, partial [Burkholderiales bacterium]|nr:hypothetical protein [Burkholderiales bacterium]
MAVSTDQLLFKLNPMNISGIQQGLESLQQSSIERQRLAQAREQLEETRRRHQEDERLRKIAEQNQMQRHTEGLAREREAEQIRRQDTLGKEFAGRLAGGDVAGANVFAALAPSVGMAINVEGMTDGLPRYRIDHDPEATAAREAEEAEMIAELPDETATESLGRMNVLGLDTADERGTLDPPIGMGGQEAFGAAQEASRFFEDTGVPMAGPDEEDLLGGIPRDVVDMGALRDMTMRKLRPGMQSLVEAYPEVYQDSADKTAQGVMELNLPPKETAELFDQLRGGGPDALIGQGIAADAARTKRGEMTFKDEFDILEGGRNRGDKLAQSYAVRDIVERRQPLSSALQVLNNETDEDDYLVGAPVARIVFGEKGATTDPDVQRVLGDEASSFFDSLKKQAYKQAFGGLSPEKKQALREVLQAKQLYDARQVMEYIDSVYDAAAKYEGHPYGEGLKESLANVPREYLQLYERMVADREKRGLSKRQALDEHVGVPNPELVRGQVEQERQRGSAAPGRPAGRGGAAGPTGSFKMPEKDDPDGFYTEFSRQAKAHGYDPGKILPLVRTETA